MHTFEDIFTVATAHIDADYFLMPVSGREDSTYRERVYCYELYHQIRKLWPDDCRHTLAGEVDKSGHPLIRGNGLDNCKPDFLVHLPGEMEGNYAAIEVKPVVASRAGVRKDLDTLTAFLEYGQYERAIYLFYGYRDDGSGPKLAAEEIGAYGARERIQIWLHSAPNEPATRYAVRAISRDRV